MPGFIASQIARINRNFLLVALLLAAVAGAIVWLGWASISAVVLGPRPVTGEDLASPQFQADPMSYKSIVRVNGTAVGPVFYSARVRKGKGYGTLYCWLLQMGDQQLIVEDWSPSASVTAAGTLKDASQSICGLTKARASANVLPVLLDQRDWKESGWLLTVCGSCLAIGVIVILWLQWWWSTHPDKHPVRRAVARLGDYESTAMQVDAEMMSEIQRFGSVHLTPAMLIYTTTFKFDVVRLNGIAAARTEWLQQGKTRALFLLMGTRDGRSVKWQIAKKDADELLMRVRTAAHLETSPQPL